MLSKAQLVINISCPDLNMYCNSDSISTSCHFCQYSAVSFVTSVDELLHYGYISIFSWMADGCSLHVNSGGNDLTLKENNTEVVYEGDANVEGGTAKYFRKINSYWGFSSTGDFMDDNDFQNARFIKNVPSANISELYRTARLSPISLTYFRYCLENGDYTVNLHFAEIYFTNDNTYSSLGRRIFDIYVQVILLWQ